MTMFIFIDNTIKQVLCLIHIFIIIDIISKRTWQYVMDDEVKKWSLRNKVTNNNQLFDAGALHTERLYNDFLLLDENHLNPSSLPFIQWFVSGDTENHIRYIFDNSEVYYNIIDCFARLDGHQKSATEYTDVWQDLKTKRLQNKWIKLVDRSDARDVDGSDYVKSNALWRAIAPIFVRQLGESITYQSTPVKDDFRIARYLYALGVIPHPSILTAPMIEKPNKIDIYEAPLITLADDAVENSNNNNKNHAMDSGYIFIVLGTTNLVKVDVWYDSLTSLHTHCQTENGPTVDVRVWRFYNVHKAYEAFQLQFRNNNYENNLLLFHRSEIDAYEHFLQTFFEADQSSNEDYVVQWMRNTGETIEHIIDMNTENITIDIVDLIKLFSRFATREATIQFMNQVQVWNDECTPHNSLLSLSSALDILYSPLLASKLSIPHMIASYRHSLKSYFLQSNVTEIRTNRSSYPMTANEFIQLRQMELRYDPSILIAEFNAQEAASRAEEAKYKYMTTQLEIGKSLNNQAAKHDANPEQSIKKTSSGKTNETGEKVTPVQYAFVAVPKRWASKVANKNIIQINNQDRKAHTKTKVPVVC